MGTHKVNSMGMLSGGGNMRMMEIQAVILMNQMNRIIEDADKRLENALYLDSKLKKIPGIIPYKLSPVYPFC